MTPDELLKIGIKLYGLKRWRVQLAAALGVNRSTIHRYEKGSTPIPQAVEMAIDQILAQRRAAKVARSLQRNFKLRKR